MHHGEYLVESIVLGTRMQMKIVSVRNVLLQDEAFSINAAMSLPKSYVKSQGKYRRLEIDCCDKRRMFLNSSEVTVTVAFTGA